MYESFMRKAVSVFEEFRIKDIDTISIRITRDLNFQTSCKLKLHFLSN